MAEPVMKYGARKGRMNRMRRWIAKASARDIRIFPVPGADLLRLYQAETEMDALGGGHTWLAVAAIINSVISLAVYMRVVVPTYFSEPEQDPAPATNPGTKLVWISTFGLTIAVGLGVQWLLV